MLTARACLAGVRARVGRVGSASFQPILADYLPVTVTVNESYLPELVEIVPETIVARSRQASWVSAPMPVSEVATSTVVATNNGMLPPKAPVDDDRLSEAGTMTTLSTVSEGELAHRRAEVEVDLGLLHRLRMSYLAQQQQHMAQRASMSSDGAPNTGTESEVDSAAERASLSRSQQPVTGRERILDMLRDYREAQAPVVPAGSVLVPQLDPNTNYFRAVPAAEAESLPQHWQHLGKLVKPVYKLPPTFEEHIKHRYNTFRVNNGLVPIVNYDLGSFADDLEDRVLPDGRRYLDVAMLL